MNTSPTADLLARAIQSCGKSQREIAEEVGFLRPNVISMLKTGEMRLPIERVPAFAKATGTDPALLLDTAMNEYMPGTWKAILSVLQTCMPGFSNLPFQTQPPPAPKAR